MADLFEKCLKNAEPVQKRMCSNMAKIRKLDVQSQLKESEANQKLTSLANSWKKLSKEEQKRNYEAVDACFTEARELCNQKIAIASETYECVDKFIQELDRDTNKFNAFMSDKMIGERKPGTSSKRSDTHLNASSRKSRTKGVESSGPSSSKNTAVGELSLEPSMSSVVNTHGDMPIDPNEPHYCVCQQVSFGNMVGCDNKNCPLEWFHFACVGLTSSPKGKWYCPQCRENKDVKKQPHMKTPKNRSKNVQE